MVYDANDQIGLGRRLHVDLDRRGSGVGRDRVGRHRDERTRAVQARLLEQAAAPAQARQRDRIAGGHGDAVGGERQTQTRREPGHDLVAPVRARAEHCCHVQLTCCLGERRSDGVGCESSKRIHPHRARLAELARQRQGLARSVALVHQDQDCHTTPAFCSISTTAGAAAAPAPSDSARRP